jgi:molybdopterin/thiamine biosynthesis adenylyltransferase
VASQIKLDEFSRISKLFVDRDQEHPERSLVRRRRHRFVLACGPEIAHSYTLQLALLTAVNVANRCFPGAIRIQIDERVAAAPLMVFPSPNRSIRRTLAAIVGHRAIRDQWAADESNQKLLFGDVSGPDDALRVTFDGWVAKTGPSNQVPRLPEREFCTLAGVLAGAIAVSEAFLSFAQVAIDASHRPVALSLWRPDLDSADPDALGVQVEFLPTQIWTLGLGHLGQAYLWALSTLPYLNYESTNIILNDFDKIESANVETGILLRKPDIGKAKTRVCSAWLESIGFNTTVIERKFGPDFRCDPSEPQLALCGFDSNETRRALYSAQFGMVVDCGLGGLAGNFDTINVQRLPSVRAIDDLWPIDPRSAMDAQRIADRSRTYDQLSSDDECGRVMLAGKAVAVPFVGAVSATYVLAEVLRALHNGAAYSRLKLRLATPHESLVSTRDDSTPPAVGAIGYSDARRLSDRPRPTARA